MADEPFATNMFGQRPSGLLAPRAVREEMLATDAVTSRVIRDGAVGNNEVAGGLLGSKLADNSIPNTKIEQVAWTTYTPVWTSSGGATGGGTIVGSYFKIGRKLTVVIDFTYTGGMTLPAGNYFLGLGSYTAVTTRYQPGVAMYHVTGGTHYAGTCSPVYAAAGGTKLAIHWHGIVNPWGQNNPVAPAVGDLMTLTWTGETTT